MIRCVCRFSSAPRPAGISMDTRTIPTQRPRRGNDTAGAAYHHHQYAGETDPDAVAAAAAAAGGTDSNRWAKNCDGLAPESLASGKFSKDETETVRRAITAYCEAHNITPGHLCSEQIDHKQECKGAWMEIARALPHRTVQSVYRHGLRQMNPFKRGVWAEDEVRALLDYVNEHGKKWSGLQVRVLVLVLVCLEICRYVASNI